MTGRAEFWSKPHAWPRDPTGYVFLARAVDAVGRAMFGEEWTGQEMTGERKPVYRIAPQASDEAHAKAEKENNEALENNRIVDAGFKRVHRVMQEIATRCESGEIVSAARWVSGGEIRHLNAHAWNTERLWVRFNTCQFEPNNPFAEKLRTDVTYLAWIFLEKESFDRFLTSQPFAPPPPGLGDLHLSPYLRLMLEVARKMNITPGNQPKKEEVAAVLRATWVGDPDLGRVFSEYMAQALREPESQLGRGAKKKSEED